jgi:hypothetical protein
MRREVQKIREKEAKVRRPVASPALTKSRPAAEGSLAEFVRQAWHVIEPTTPLVWSWHMDAISLHLEALLAGRLSNIYFGVPPGSTKSIIVNVMFIAWAWIDQPSLRFLCAANDAGLSTRDSLSCRDLIQSDWYQQRWGDRFQLKVDQNVKQKFNNDKRGFRESRMVNGPIVGRKGDILILDDPHDPDEVESQTQRESVIHWHDKAYFNRVNNFKCARRIYIGQRTHSADLFAKLLADGTCEGVILPEEFVLEKRCHTSIGWEDPRTKPGEWLRPERFGPAEKAQVLRRLGSFGYAAQHQQDPVLAEGNLFKADWFRYYTRQQTGFDVDGKFYHQDECFWFATVDPAGGTSSHADYTVIGIFAVTPKNHLLWVHADRSRTPIEEIVPHIQATVEGWPLVYIAIEGAFLQHRLVVEPARKVKGLPPIRQVLPTGKAGERGKGNKYLRAVPAIIAMEAGSIWLKKNNKGVKAAWLEFVEPELLQFTGQDGDHDDCADVLSYAVHEWEIGQYAGAEPLILGERPDNFWTGSSGGGHRESTTRTSSRIPGFI